MNRFENYDKDHCWQYEVKMSLLESDLEFFNINPDDIKIQDLSFEYIDASDKQRCLDVRNFIEKYEWLGKLPVWVTHRFASYYKDIMVAAIVMATPNRFSELLGKEYRNREKLISRGATISFAPKNTASWIIMKSIEWMAKNTEFVLFTSYADPNAKELGTVYQACNFFYLGNAYGDTVSYINKNNGKSFGSSYFSQRSVIKRAAIAYGVPWKTEYVKLNANGNKRIINWNVMSDELKDQIKAAVSRYKSECFDKIDALPKHKYAYVLGHNFSETKNLRSLFVSLNRVFPYPRQRGA